MTTTVTQRPPLRLRADLKCLVCGHLAGEAEGVYGTPIRLTKVTPVGSPVWQPRAGEPLRCPRCEGRLHLDEIETFRDRAPRPAQTEQPAALRRAS